MNKQKYARTRLVKAWTKASGELGIRVTAPYLLRYDGDAFECVAYLPDFGSVNGMVIDLILPPAYLPRPGLREAAIAQGMFWSSINMERYESYDAEVFKDALRDWGYFGSDGERPEWI